MRFLKLQALQKHLKSSYPDHLADVYLFLGAKEYEKEEAVQYLLKLFSEASSPFSIKIFDADKSSPQDLFEELNTIMAFEKKRLVLCKGIDDLPKSFYPSLEQYLEQANSSVCLVLLARSLAKGLQKKIEEKGVILELAEEKPWEKEKLSDRWIESFVKGKQKVMSSEARRVLLLSIGHDKQFLSVELQKLLTFVGDRKEITKEDVFAISSYHHQETVWQLLDALFARQPTKALKVLRGLFLEDVAPPSLLQQLRHQFQMLLFLLHSHKQGDMEKLSKRYPFLKGKLLQKHLETANRVQENFLRKGLLAIFEADLASRSGLEPVDLVLERLIHLLASEKELSHS